MPHLLLLALLGGGVVALTPATISEAQAARIFGRLADKKLLLDVPGAGTPEMRNCCHGGCDNCDYSRVFDEMNAGKPKWVPCYPYRQLIDGRDHTAPWAELFDDGPLTAETFTDRLNLLTFRSSMGYSAVKPDDSKVDADAAVAFFTAIAQGANELTADAFANGLAVVSGEAHGAPWKRFLQGLS